MDGRALVRQMSREFEQVSAAFQSPSRKVKTSDIAAWTRQLATLIKAGLPLLNALELLSGESESPTLKDAVRLLMDRIRKGDTFSHALIQQPDAFPSMMASMVQAGEISGQLELVLEKYADFMERQEDTKKRLQSMLVYPALLLSLGVLSIAFLLLFVIPRFMGIFQEFGQQLPWITRVLLGVSTFLRENRWVMAVSLVAVFFGMRAWLQTPGGRRTWTITTFALPLVGPLMMKVEFSRFTLMLGTLVGSGVPIMDALAAVKGIMRHPQLVEDVGIVGQQIRRGRSLAEAMKTCKAFPSLMVQMVVVGEETGKPEDLLGHLHTFYERGVDRGTRTLLSLIEPILVVGMGCVVAVMVMAVLLPILTLSTGAQ